MYAARNVAVSVGDTVFAHAGILPEHAFYGVDHINEDARRWLTGEVDVLPESLRWPDSPFWTRRYGGTEGEEETCASVAQALDILGLERMVVGHTIQEQGINSACDGTLWRIDIGVSSFYGDRPPQVLEIANDRVRVLTADAKSR